MAEARKLSDFEFHHVLEATQGIALVMFSAPACGACKQLRQILSQDDFSAMSFFEVDASTDMGITREFEVFHLPALFLFVDGQYHSEIQAEAHPQPIRRAIEAAMLQPAEEAP